ncbi:MAG: hypothetical protein ACON49_00005, partial [Candidatus Puniceispirillaceae bacterium]
MVAMIDCDPVFANQVDDALVQARERLLYEALSRAIIGIEEPRYYKGEIIGYEHKPSDLLLRY